MSYHVISNLPKKELAPGVVMSSVNLKNLMVTFVSLQDGAVVPEHSHPHEQISVVISGMLRFTVGEEQYSVKEGEAVLVPSNRKHSAVAVNGPCVAYDSWSPVRDDYILERL